MLFYLHTRVFSAINIVSLYVRDGKTASMKKYILLFCTCFILSFGAKTFYDMQTYKNDLYVYADVEAGPGLLEMTAFIKAPAKVRKLIAWAPWRGLKHRVNLDDFNAREIDFNTQPNEKYYYHIMNKLAEELSAEVKKNPDIQITLYTNLDYISDMLSNIRRVISDRNIKQIHLYENGFGQTVGKRKDILLKHVFLKGPPKKPQHPAAPFYTHEMFKTTYHVGYLNIIRKSPEFKGFLSLMDDTEIKNVDYKKIAKSFSRSDKKKLAQLLGINIGEYKKAYKEATKKTAFLIGPKPLNKKETEAQIFVLGELIEANDYQWFFKPHPHPSSNVITKRLKKRFSNLAIIPAQIPIEAFLFLDILPDYVGGYSSSAFFTLDKNLFLFYIKRPQDMYLPFLLEQGILKRSQTLKLPSP